jgi:NAD(P)-dependent dehydrogenase (short-subunit alcohol dehydrogenase family)
MAPELRFEKKVAVVTGAGSGVGRAYALELARRGARVVVNDLGGATDGTGASEAAAKRVVAEIQSAGGEAVASTDSVAGFDSGKRIVDTALERFGACDILIANAGILRDKSFPKLERSDLEAVLDVHLTGAFATAQPAFRHMKDSGRGGKIVLTTSSSGLFGNFGQANYAAAKMGIWGLMRVLSIEGARCNVQVNCVAPGATTRLTGNASEDGPGAPRRVSALVLALVHESCRITGETFQAGFNWYTRVFMAQGSGWAAAPDAEVTAEDVAAHWDTIRESAGFTEVENALVCLKGAERARQR